MRRKLVIKRWWRGRTKSRYTRVGVETSLSSASQNKVGNLRKSWSLLVVEKRQWNRSTLERTNTTHTLITTTRQPTHRRNQQPFLTCGDKNPSRTCFSAFWWPFLPESYESARSRRHTDMPKFSLKSKNDTSEALRAAANHRGSRFERQDNQPIGVRYSLFSPP